MTDGKKKKKHYKWASGKNNKTIYIHDMTPLINCREVTITNKNVF